MSVEDRRVQLAAAYDPPAFDDTFKKSTRPVAEIQWAARRHMALTAADTAAPLLVEWLEAARRNGLQEALRVAEAEEERESHKGSDRGELASGNIAAAIRELQAKTS